MRRKRVIAPLLIMLLLTVSGCWDAASPEQMAWVTALGVDEGPDENLIFTFQVVIPKAVGTGGAQQGGPGGSQGHSFLVFSVAAPDVITAVELSDAFVARRVSLQHAKALILGEAIVRRGISEFLAPAIRYRDFRRTLFVVVAKGTAREFLQHARPRLEADPALWYEMMMHWQRETHLVPPMRIHQLVIALESPGLGGRAALVAARPDLADNPDQLGGQVGEGPSNLEAGSLFRSGEVPVEFLGTAVFKGDKLAGLLSGQETRVVALLRGELNRRTPVTIPDPKDPKHRVVLMMRVQRRPQVRVAFKGSRVAANFHISVEGDIGSIPSVIDYTNPADMRILEDAAERFIKTNVEKVLDQTLHEWAIDMYRIGDHVRVGFPTLQSWLAFDWSRQVGKVQYTVDLEFRIRRHGQQKEPASPER